MAPDDTIRSPHATLPWIAARKAGSTAKPPSNPTYGKITHGGVRGLQVAGFRLRVVVGFRFPVHGNGLPRFQVAGPSSRPRPVGADSARNSEMRHAVV